VSGEAARSSIDPQVDALRQQRAASAGMPLYTLSVQEARAADLAAVREEAGEPEPVARVDELTIPGPGGSLRIRVYRPEAMAPLPALVYLFGGGWALGSLETSDGICRALANLAGCLVVSIGYRLAPEHPFPAAVEDCYAGIRWVARNAERLGADQDRIAVGGDSAGGNLAAAVTLLARDRGEPPLVFQLLVYPVTDYLPDTASMRENVDPLFFNRESVAWYWGHYLTRQEDAANPLAAPMRAPSLAALPAALVITAEFDPLRDEGEEYAERLRRSGVPTEQIRYRGMIHGFFAMAGVLDAGRNALELAADRLRHAFAAVGPGPHGTDEAQTLSSPRQSGIGDI